MLKRIFAFALILTMLTSCGIIPSLSLSEPVFIPTPGPAPTLTSQETKIPSFDHIILIMFENRDYNQVIGSKDMPTFNQLASENVLLTNYYAITHPSLPNYIGIVSGDTFGINTDCTNCFLKEHNLADVIEASGRTWKTYQEDLPSPCFVGSSGNYAQKHDPFIYFDSIRQVPQRCDKSIVPLTALNKDLAANQLPNFAVIEPNLCNSGHNCSSAVADKWLKQIMQTLQGSPALGQKYMIFITFDEAPGDNSSCCGFPSGGGHVAAVLISPQAKQGYQDATALMHYSFLKTVLISWRLPLLGYTGKSNVLSITSPWK